MKAILALCAAVLLIAGALIYRATRMPSLYGEFAGVPKVAVIDLIEHPKDYLKKTVAVEGVIRDQCTTMGCFFFFFEGERKLRIDLEAVAMNAPKGRNGRPARVEGMLVPFTDGYQLWASAVEFK